jgi:hypothetical protein
MIRRFTIVAVAIAIWLGAAQRVEAQTVVCLNPGEFKDDFSFDKTVVNDSLIRKARTIGSFHWPAETLGNPGIFGKTTVEFGDRAIRLLALATRQVGIPLGRQIEAFARGKLSLDFQVDCGSTGNAPVVVAVSFRVRQVGRMTTFWPGSTSTIGVSARIRDVADNRDIDFRVIEDTTVGNLLGSFKTIAKVPIPIPDVQGMSLAKVETFVIPVRKGRVYRFELFAAAKSTTGLTASPGPVASANFQDPVDLQGHFEHAGVELVDFSMDVPPDPTDVQAELSELKRMVESLRDSVATLNVQLEAVGSNMGVLVSELNEKLGEQDEKQHQAVEALRAELETQTGTLGQRLEALALELANHTHDYRTGEGDGHNNVVVTTSPPKKVP